LKYKFANNAVPSRKPCAHKGKHDYGKQAGKRRGRRQTVVDRRPVKREPRQKGKIRDTELTK